MASGKRRRISLSSLARASIRRFRRTRSKCVTHTGTQRERSVKIKLKIKKTYFENQIKMKMKIKSKYFEYIVSGTFSQNLKTVCHFLNISVKFRQNFIKISPKNRKIHRKARTK